MPGQSPFANITPVVKNLLIINLLCFVPYIVMADYNYDNLVVSNFGVYYFNSPHFRVWQLITYMFLHGGWTHIIFNMFALFSFGPILEYSIGPKRFFNLYFICGIGAALFQMLVQAFEVHALIGSFTVPYGLEVNDIVGTKLAAIYAVPVVGASGAVFGVLVAFGVLYPNMELMMMFIPVPIKAKYIISVYVLYELYYSFKQVQGDPVAHLAHIGGAILGFVLIKIWRLR